MAFKNLTKAFVEELVKEPILSYGTSQGADKGDNNAGELLGITVTTRANKQIHLIYKVLSDESELVRGFAEHYGIFCKEKLMYSTIIPMLEGIAKTSLPFPKYYGGSSERYKEFICLEDLRQNPSRTYTMFDKFKSLTLKETSLVLKELGKFHALTYFLIQWEGEKLFESTEAFQVLKKKRFGRIADLDRRETEMFIKLFHVGIGLIEERDPKLAAKMRNLDYGNNLTTILETCTLTESKYFPVIIHGDLWVNNILFGRDNQNQLQDLKIIDFQMSRRGNIFEDLQYFIFTSTTPAFREQHLYQVLNIYFDSFEATLNSLNWPLPPNFSRGSLIDGFNGTYLCAYRYLFMAIPFQLGVPVDLSNDAVPQQNGVNQNDVKSNHAPEGFDVSSLFLPLKKGFEKSAAAIDRLEDVTRELVKLKFL